MLEPNIAFYLSCALSLFSIIAYSLVLVLAIFSPQRITPLYSAVPVPAWLKPMFMAALATTLLIFLMRGLLLGANSYTSFSIYPGELLAILVHFEFTPILLASLLLIWAPSSVFWFAVFCVIGGGLLSDRGLMLAPLVAVPSLVLSIILKLNKP